MLTHQKTKPFVCIEQGCSKSYCDYRSLRRHYEVQHGLCILKEAPPEEEACGDSPHAREAAGRPAPGGSRAPGPPEARSPGSLLPNRDLLRCIVSSIVHRKVPSPGPAGPPDGGEERTAARPRAPSSGPSSCTPAGMPGAPGNLGTEVPEEPRPPRKEPAAAMFTAIHRRAVENGGTDPAGPEPPLLQRPPVPEGWPEGGPRPARLPLFRGQTVPAGSQPSSHNFQWLRNLPGCPKSKGNNVFVVHKPPSVPSREGCEPGPGPSSTSPVAEPSPGVGTGREDASSPYPATFLKAPGEASGDPRYAGGEDDSWGSKKSKFDCDSFLWQNPGEPGLQETQKPSGLPSDATPLFRQLFLKSQESLVSHEQMQVFQMIAKSQRIFSQLPGPEGKQAALKPLPGPWPQQPPPPAAPVDSLHAGPGNPEPEGSPARRRKATPAFPREASPGGTRREAKGGLKTATAPPSLPASSLDPPRNPDLSSLAKHLRSTKGTLDLGDVISPGGPRQTQSGGDEPLGAPLPGKQAQAENGAALGAAKGEKSQACARGGGYRLFSGNPRSQRFSGFRKEKLKTDMCCAASPSQVAMASFSSAGPLAEPPQDSKSKLTIFNRIQVPGPSLTGRDHARDESLVGSSFVRLLVGQPLCLVSGSPQPQLRRGGNEGSERLWVLLSTPTPVQSSALSEMLSFLGFLSWLPFCLSLPFGFASLTCSEDVKVEFPPPSVFLHLMPGLPWWESRSPRRPAPAEQTVLAGGTHQVWAWRGRESRRRQREGERENPMQAPHHRRGAQCGAQAHWKQGSISPKVGLELTNC